MAELLGQRKRNRLLAYGTVYPLGETPDEVRGNIDRGLKLGLKAIKIVADPHLARGRPTRRRPSSAPRASMWARTSG